jgi:hypothetical protein
MAVINTGNTPKLLWPGLNAVWGRDYEEHPKEFPDLFDIETSDMNYEEEVEMTGFGLASVKQQGAATPYDTESQQSVTRYTHVAFGSRLYRDPRGDRRQPLREEGRHPDFGAGLLVPPDQGECRGQRL